MGAFANLNIGRIIIQPELLWFKSGNVLNFDIDPSVEFDTELTVDMHPSVTLTQQNMAFPIFIGTKISFLRLYAGPVMYFVLSQKQEVEANGQKKSVNFDNLDAQGMTWGAALNVGVDIWRLTFDINYSFGLSSVFKTDQINWSFGEQSGSFKLDKTKQNVFTITVGLKIL